MYISGDRVQAIGHRGDRRRVSMVTRYHSGPEIVEIGPLMARFREMRSGVGLPLDGGAVRLEISKLHVVGCIIAKISGH